MSIFHKGKKSVPEFTGLQVQVATNVLPIPIMYGTPRVVGNLIYANGFRTVAHSQGGKGLLSGGKGPQTFTYSETFILGLGEGEVSQVVVSFKDQGIFPALGGLPEPDSIFYFDGTQTSPWSVLTSQYPADAFVYKDTAYIGFLDYGLDSSATIPQFAFVVVGKFTGTSPLNYVSIQDSSTQPPGFIGPDVWDADPAQCVYDFLTNETYGAGFPAQYIDTTLLNTSPAGFNPSVGDSALSTYCQAIGMAFSIVLNNFEPASSILQRWMDVLTVAPVWTGAILKFIPYWDTFSGANPNWNSFPDIGMKYFAPSVTPIFDLNDDDFEQAAAEDDPVTIERIDIADVKNVVRFDFKDRYNQWNDNYVEAKDENLVEQFGLRVETMTAADVFTLDVYAAMAAQVRLQRNAAIRNKFTFKLGWQFCILDPMDIITITDSVLGLDHFPVRIQSIEEDDKGILTVIAEEFPLGAASATLYPKQQNAPIIIVSNQAPPSVNTPLIFEPTAQLLAAEGATSQAIVMGVSGGPAGTFNPNWGGANVFISTDNVTYVQQGTKQGPSRQGLLTATLAAYSSTNPDTTHTLSVNVTESNSALETVTSDQAAAGLSLCVIVDTLGGIEFLSYETATLTSAGHYNLTTLYRGLYGTEACQHLTGSQFLRLDSLIYEQTLPPQFIGQELFLKLQSFNVFNQEPQDLSDCTVYTYTPTGAGTDFTSDPIIAALLLGNNVDLNVAATEDLDLNNGGAGECAPTLITVDLNS